MEPKLPATLNLDIKKGAASSGTSHIRDCGSAIARIQGDSNSDAEPAAGKYLDKDLRVGALLRKL